MDRSAAMLQEAERRLSGVPLLAGTLEGLPFRDACMDGIVCECVLSLSYTPERALGEMGRVLRPGGRLLLTDIVVREVSHGAGGQGCARGAVPADVVAERLARQGFRILASEDHSRLLGELAGRLLFQGVPRSALLAWMGACPGSGDSACSGKNSSGIGCSSRKRGANERIDVGTHTSDSGRILLQPAPRPARLAAAGCGKSRVGQGRWRALSRNKGKAAVRCGLLTGGAAALGYLACKGAAGEAAHPMAEPLINDYAAWFAQHVCTGGCWDVFLPIDSGKNGQRR